MSRETNNFTTYVAIVEGERFPPQDFNQSLPFPLIRAIIATQKVLLGQISLVVSQEWCCFCISSPDFQAKNVQPACGFDLNTGFINLSPTDPSLTLGNLTQLLKDVEDWNHVGYYLDTPQSVSEQIISHHSSVSEREEACWRWYLDNHLSPSWRQVAYAIYERREHAVLEVLKSHYLKGEL